MDMPIADRFEFIPADHFLSLVATEPKENLPRNATGLWVETQGKWADDGSPETIDIDELSDHLMRNANTRKLMIQAGGRGVPVFAGDIAPPIGTVLYEAGCGLAEALGSFMAFAASSRRMNGPAITKMQSIIEAVRGKSKEAQEAEHLSTKPVGMTRRVILGLLGSWLVEPMVNNGLVQGYASETRMGRIGRDTNNLLHPFYHTHIVRVRDAVQALKIDFADQELGQAHPVAVFGAGHGGIGDELRTSTQAKIDFLTKSALPYLALPQTYQFDELRWEGRNAKTGAQSHWKHVATHEVPALKEFAEGVGK